MHTITKTLATAFLLAMGTVAMGGEDIMPMVAGPWAIADRDAVPVASGGAGLDIGPLIGRQPKGEPVEAARPALHKNVIRLTLPASQSAAAISEELAPFMFDDEPSTAAATASRSGSRSGSAPAAPPASAAAIPGLMTPETLASLPSRDFREDLGDLVSFDGTETFQSAAYTMPISSPTYVAPAPEEFIPVPPPVASLSLPRPNEVMVPPPIADAPPLPYLDPLAQPAPASNQNGPAVLQKDFGSKTQALIRIPSNAARMPVRPPAEPAGSMSLRPPPSASSQPAFEERIQTPELPARLFPVSPSLPGEGETAGRGAEVPNLSGPLLSIRTHDDAPRARKKFVEKPEVISGVPALAPTQFKAKAKTAEVAGGTAQKPAGANKTGDDSAGGFAPLRSLKGLFWGKEK